jgi:hypothetical protein
MSTAELKNRLIEKIKETENEELLGEAYRLLELETMDLEVYKLSNEQKSAIAEARQQIKGGQFLSDEQASNEIDEWLNK